MAASTLKPGDPVEVYKTWQGSAILWLGVVTRVTAARLFVRPDTGGDEVPFDRTTGAQRPQKVVERFVRARSKGASHARA